jgi:ribosomal protein L37AE/L43A
MSSAIVLPLLLAAMGGGLMGMEWYENSSNTFSDPPRRRYPQGPCRVCGKPNVRRGRDEGVYLCGKCSQENAGGMARELAAQDSDNSNDING